MIKSRWTLRLVSLWNSSSAKCHPPERDFTDARRHDVDSVSKVELRMAHEHGVLVPRSFNTPSLKSLVQTAPYLHDGSASSLASLIESNHDRMGATNQLSADERHALVAYLESL